MKLLDFINMHPRSERPALAHACGTSLAYLKQVAGGHKKPNVKLSLNIARLSDYRVPLKSLRPDIDWVQWHEDIGCDIKRAA